MKIQRAILQKVISDLTGSNKIVVLYGARQTGKTTLSNDALTGMEGKILKVNADEIRFVDVLSSRDFDKIRLLVEGYDVLFVDEAQRIPDIGINLKIIFDNMPLMKILVTGSSSFELANKVKEPLTGRTITHSLFPVSLAELRNHYSVFEIQNRLEEFMLYGTYPAVFQFNNSLEKVQYLQELSSAYLYKDIFELSSIRNNSVITQLLKLLALQIGSEVSLNELAQNLKISQETVNSYINLLEKAFIVFRLSGFGKNLRKEISKRDKIYFWDLGIRNMLIGQFSPLSVRQDAGALWENFLIAERRKYLSYNQIFASSYFWRTYTGAELDYVEETGGELFAYEIKYKKPRPNPPVTWTENYGNRYKCVTYENFFEFVM